MMRQIFIYAVLLFGSLVFQKAFGLYSLVFVSLFLCAHHAKNKKLFPFILFIVSLVEDLVFFRRLGTIGMVYALAFILWEGSTSVMRWRFPLFMLFGFGVTVAFFSLDAVPFTLLAFFREGCVLIGGWIALRFFSKPKHTHIRLSFTDHDADA